MDIPRDETRPCAHCGGSIAPDDTTCATCGRVYIPDTDDPDPLLPPQAEAGAAPPPPSLSGPGDITPVAPSPSAIAPTEESRMWAIGAHLSALAGVLLGGLPAFLGPLIVWLLRRDRDDPFATDHAREALNFNISIIIYVIAAVVVSILTLGLALLVVLPLALVAFVAYVVVTVKAAMAASRGEYYRYPLTIRLVT